MSKNTSYDLLMRYYKDYNGDILIDNKDIHKIFSNDLYIVNELNNKGMKIIK